MNCRKLLLEARVWMIAALIVSPIITVRSVAAPPPQAEDIGAAAAVTAPYSEAAVSEAANRLLGLTASRVFELGVDPTPAMPIVATVTFDDEQFTLDLLPYSVRDTSYELRVQLESGKIVPFEPGPIRTLRGVVSELPESVVAASLLEDGLYVRIMLADGQQYWIEPIGSRVAGAHLDDYVSYHNDDVIPNGKACGLDANMVLPTDDDQGGPRGTACGGAVCVAQLACDADREYFVAYGSVAAVESRINSVINTVNVQYERDVDITHTITTIIVRTAEPDPYSSTDSHTLLTQFRNEWINNQGGVTRDVAQLFTAKSISGGIIGEAWTLGGICTTSAYCYVWSDCCGSTACATDLSAHELGHLWGADHCSCDSPAYTMNPYITCINRFHPTLTIPEIVAHRNSRTCLSGGGGAVCGNGIVEPGEQCDPPNGTTCDANCQNIIPGPGNDACSNATTLCPGSVTGSTSTATLDGSASCGTSSSTPDLWYKYTPGSSGSMTVSTCTGSDYDTVLSVHSGCPGTSGNQLACNDDACATTRSSITLAVTGGTTYYIRVAGYQGATGNFTLTLTGPACGGGGGPANDACANRIAIGNGTFNFDTTGATTDGPDEPGACTFFSYTQVGSDIWYCYTASCTGTATASLCGSGYDTKIAVYNGCSCPSSASAIACNDDSCDLQSEVSFPVTNGNQYLIRVGGYNSATGAGTMTVSCAGSGPVCGNGVVEAGEDCDPPNGTTCDATCHNIPIVCGNGIVQPGEQCDPPNGTTCDASCQNIPIVCGNGIVQPGEQCDPPNGTTCDGNCQNIPIVCGNGVVQPGEQCDPPDGVTCDANCQNIIPTAPPNDACANAIAIGAGTRTFDTTNATTDGPDEPGACNFFSYTNVGSDIWYCYTAACNGTATITLCGSAYDTKIAVYNGCSCPSGASAIACNDDSCSLQSEVTFATSAGGNYLVRIGGYNGLTGTGTMTVSCQGASCVAPALLSAHSIATHKTGGASTAEFYVDLNISDNPATRTSEPRDSGLKTLDFQFDRDVLSASVSIANSGGTVASGPLTLLSGTNGPQSRGRYTMTLPLTNDTVYTMTVSASTGAGCDLTHELCAVGQTGDFDSDGAVTAADKAVMLGFVFQTITQTNAAYDLQVNGGTSGTIEVADVATWTGFFGNTVVGNACP